jgi:hypothetical protein
MAIAQPLPQTRSRLGGAWDALLRRDAATQAAVPAVSFGEVVWAHHQRQEKEVYKDAFAGDWHEEYRRRLELFCAHHGDIVDAYWCRYEASGVALTEKKLPRRLTNFYRRDSILKLHTATDWRTANAPVIASTLYRWHTAAIKAGEVLRDTSERIALHRIFAASTRLLAFVDRKRDDASITDADVDAVVRDHDREIADLNDYYGRAGENGARIVYFRGMMWGTAALALLLGGGFLAAWWFGWIDPHHEPTYTLFVAIGMGAAGAVLSVMMRMAQEGFSLEFEVGRKSVRYLGGIRPWIGALSAFVVYLAIKSDLVEFLQGREKGIYFYATIAFVSGFSERRARVLLRRIADDDGGPRGGNGGNSGNGSNGGTGGDRTKIGSGAAAAGGATTATELAAEEQTEEHP